MHCAFLNDIEVLKRHMLLKAIPTDLSEMQFFPSLLLITSSFRLQSSPTLRMNCCSTGNVLPSTNPRHKVKALCWQVVPKSLQGQQKRNFYSGVQIGIHLFAKIICCGPEAVQSLAKRKQGIFYPFSAFNIFNNYFVYYVEIQTLFSVLCHSMLPVMLVCDAQPRSRRMLLYEDDRELSRHFHKLCSSDRATP